jgi:tRNA(Leu) C34 or U34 (ribose-2'-O)-methylase TrmL
MADLRLRIPMSRPVESLNVGVAASLVLFEAMRQRDLAARGSGFGDRESGVWGRES